MLGAVHRPYRVVVGQAGARRARPGRQGHRPRAARRRLRGRLHRAAPDARADRRRRRPRGRRRARALAALGRAPHPRAARDRRSSPPPGATTSSSSSAGSSPTPTSPSLEAVGVARVFTPGRVAGRDRLVAARGARRARDTGERRSLAPGPDGDMDLFEYQGKQYFARFGIAVSPGGVADTRRRGRRRRRRGRLPRGRQGPGQGRRPRQGRRHQAGRRRRRGAGARRGDPGPGHQGPRRAAPLGRARERHRRGVLRELHARPAEQGPPRDAERPGRRRDRGRRRRRTPTRSPRLAIDPIRGLDLETARRWVAEAGLDEAGASRPPSCSCDLYRCYDEGDCDLAEVNPLILTPDGSVHALDAKVTLDDNAAFRHPEWDEYARPRPRTRARRWPRSAGSTTSGSTARSASSPTAPGWR